MKKHLPRNFDEWMYAILGIVVGITLYWGLKYAFVYSLNSFELDKRGWYQTGHNNYKYCPFCGRDLNKVL